MTMVDTIERSQGLPATGSTPVLRVDRLVKHFPLRRGLAFWKPPPAVRAVDGVSFDVERGTTYGLVGESGSGKSTIAKLILRLEEPTEGDVLFEGRSIYGLRRGDLRRYRSEVQAVFQNPNASLNPRMRVSELVGELLSLHKGLRGARRRERVQELLRLVGLQEGHITRFPHEFSGGQQQRIAIARAISTNPTLLVLDEPVSALDVSIRAQVLNLLSELQREFDLTYLLIAHDLAVVQRVSTTIGVLYLGKLVEECPSDELTKRPLHPYTQALLSAVPIPDPKLRTKRSAVQGEIGSAINPPSGCRFHPRCPIAEERCSVEEPALRRVDTGHRVACHLVSDSGELMGANRL